MNWTSVLAVPRRNLVIAVDYDYTLCYGSSFPGRGTLRPLAAAIMSAWSLEGHTIILHTCRSGEALQEAMDHLRENDIPFHYVNENIPDMIALYGGDTRKVSCDLSFDDRSLPLGTPVDWEAFARLVHYHSKPKVLCIVGESGSGKSMAASYLADTYGVGLVQSRTTRPRRTPTEDGHTFVTDEEFDTYPEDHMLAVTNFGGWWMNDGVRAEGTREEWLTHRLAGPYHDYRYCCLTDDINYRSNTYVIDDSGYHYLKQKWGSQLSIVGVRIVRDEALRLQHVGKDRIARDKGKFFSGPDQFDKVITNNGTVEELYRQLDILASEYQIHI